MPNADRTLIAVLFFIAAASDALDGWLARKFNQVTDLGKFMDAIVDKVLILSILILFVEQHQCPALPVILLVTRESLVSGWRMILATKDVVLPAGKIGKLKMVTEVIAILMIILNLPEAISMLWVAVFFSLVSGVRYFVLHKSKLKKVKIWAP